MTSFVLSYALILLGLSLTTLVSNHLFGLRFLPTHLLRSAEESTHNVAVRPVHVKRNVTAANYCHLNDINISGPIHLWSMIAASSSNMIGHFVRHYKSVGVPVENMSFLIQFNTEEELEAAFIVLEEKGVDTDKISATESYHSNIKRDAVNKHIQSLPSDAWLVYPDLDEFFYFPCVVPMPFKALCGHLIDRFAFTEPDVPIPSVDANTENTLPKQFPKCRKVRGREGFFTNADDRKMLLFPVRVQYPGMGRYLAKFKNSHALYYSFIERLDNSKRSRRRDFEVECEADRGAIDHYVWSSEQIDLAYKKLIMYTKSSQEKDGEASIQDSKRKSVYEQTLVTVSRNTTTATWSLKSHWAGAINEHKVSCPKMARQGKGKPIGRDRCWEGNGMEPVHIVYAANEDSVAGVEASIRSIRAHASGPAEFYFIGDIPLPTMPEVHWFNLTDVVQKYSIEDYMNWNSTRKDRRRDTINIYQSNYARFALDKLMTDQRKVMYIDVDTIVLCDTYSLINGVLNDGNDDVAIAAVPRTTVSEKEKTKHVIRGLTPRGVEEAASLKKSFNAGIYVVDLEKWRAQGISERIRQIALHNRQERLYWLGSQPPFNIAIGERFEEIPQQWNRNPENYNNRRKLEKSGTEGKRRARNQRTKEYEDVCVLHYKGGRKPWQGVGPMPDEWLPYGHVVK